MTKNGKRVSFLLVATLANMLLTIIIIVLLFIGLNALTASLGLKNFGMVVILTCFLGGVVLSGLIYAKVLKALRRRPDLEERFGLSK